MKKSELLNVLKDNNVKSTNLRSFMNKNKANKELITNFDKARNWLIESEKVEAEKERELKIKKQAVKFNMSVRRYKRLQVLCNILMGSINSGYSMGEIKNVYVNNKLFFSVDDTYEYANSCRYKATHGAVRLDLNKKQLLSLKRCICGCNGITCEGKHLTTSGNKGSFEITF